MPNTKETVRALVSAFNVHNYARNTVETNFTLQRRGKKDYIVVSFDKSMGTYQCRRYLDSIKRKIIREFYGIEKGNKAEILDTANLIFDVNSFPFENYKDVESFPLKNYKGDWFVDKQGSIKFVTPVDDGVIFNLKSHLASSLEKDVLEDMKISSTTAPFNKEKYLCHSKFPNKKLCKEFEHEFLSRMKARYENVPKKPLEVNVKDNSVYIKDVFDNARFIDSVTRYKAWLTGMDLGVGNDVDHSVKSFKNMIIKSTYSVTKVMIDGFILAPPLNERVVSILTPITQSGKGIKLLTKEEVRAINRAFNNAVLDDISGRTQAKLSTNGSSEVYGIDFSNPYISHCVITKIIENSVINKDHELSIDPELRFRALSRSPSTELSDTQLESPTRSPDGALDGSPRQWSEREEETEPFRGVLGEEIGQASTSSQQTDDMPRRPYTSRCRRKPLMSQPSMLRELSLSEGADESMLIEIRGQQVRYRPSLTPPLIAWDDSTFLNLEVSNEEPEKQQVTDKSDRKSSDEYSEAKSQDSKSPKKHGGGVQKIKKFFSSHFKKQHDVNLKRHDEGRDTTRSTPETPVTEKPLLSKRSPSLPIEIVKSRSLKVTPVTEVHTENKPTELNDSITELPSQGTVGKLNMPGDHSSKISVDSGLGSLERSQSLPLTEKSSGSSQRKQNILKQFFSAFLSDKGKTTKDILFDEETFSRFSSGMQKVLSLSLSCDMVSNLCRFFPINEHEELIVLARSGKVKKSRSPEEIEQLFSSFSREEKEICSLLFFPEKQNEMCENLSPTAKEQVDLFWTILDERGISGNASTSSKDSGVSLGSSSQKSTSDTGSDEDELEASGESLISSNSSTSTIRTKMYSPEIKKLLQEEIFV